MQFHIMDVSPRLELNCKLTLLRIIFATLRQNQRSLHAEGISSFIERARRINLRYFGNPHHPMCCHTDTQGDSVFLRH
jgi:hypothetical protein